MAGGKNFVGQFGQGAANSRHQGRRRREGRHAFTIRFYGEEIAAVAGTSKQACLDALRAIEVKAERAATILSSMKTRRARKTHRKSGTAHPTPRLRMSAKRGNVDTAFPECAAVIEGFYTTPVQIHHPMETHGNTASWTDEGVTAWASTQGISSVRDGLAGALATGSKPGARHHRIHGRRVWREIRRGRRRRSRGETFQRSESAGPPDAHAV